ncbi:hypothetical protein AGMMS49991_08410 [Spirochaetia bacterium]|nr:hypothetical protein AGMMS49991_08410 [Spirochaetia bacterium]
MVGLFNGRKRLWSRPAMRRARPPPKSEYKNQGRLTGVLPRRNQIALAITGRAEMSINSNRIHNPVI